jgi:hypothetical protein
MAGRVLRLTPGFARARAKLGITAGSPRARAVAACISAINDAAVLPGPLDVETEFRPGTAFVRRVGGVNLWVWFRLVGNDVAILSITDEPPVPWDG